MKLVTLDNPPAARAEASAEGSAPQRLNPPRFGPRWCAVVAALLAPGPALSGQSALPRAAAQRGDPGAVQLSVFEVTAGKDLGYAAASAMTGTRTGEKLADLPNSISVMTQEFLQDIAVNNFLDAVEFATNAENLYNDSGTRGAAIGSRSGNQISFRGMASIRQLRDGFPWYMPQDIYNTERIEFSRGPGGLAFGDVDVGGIINITTKRANATRQASAQVRYDNWGSQRYSVDVNQPLAETGVSVRLNAIRAENESWRQRSGTELRGLAGAMRWEPFKHHRTVIDFTYEHGDQDEGFSHVVLDDQTAAYVRGTGTNALDANPNLAGVQVNGVGMQQIRAATGVDHLFGLIDGKIYSLQSTPTATFRSSMVQIGATVAAGTDPVNPLRFPIIGVSERIVPRGQDWGGPINKLNSKFHAYTLEFRHAFNQRLSVLFAHNGQKDDTRRINVFNGNVAGVGIRDVLIDVNPNLPDPTDPTRTRLLANPRFEQSYSVHNPVTLIDGHDIKNFRGVAVYDAPLPWSIKQRLVFSGGYRHESYYKDAFTRSLAREEILRRGFSGNAAFYTNNLFYYYHYLKDGNGDAALANDHLPNVTTDFRFTHGGGSQRFKQNLTSGSLNALGSYFNGKVRSSIGLSRDHWVQDSFRPLVADPFTNEQSFVDLSGNRIANQGTAYVAVPLARNADQWVTNQTYGAVWHVTPWVSLTGGYFESSLFSDNVGLDLNGRALAPRTGEGADYCVRFNLLDQRVSLNLTYFQNTAENISSGVAATVQTELTPFLAVPFVNTTDYRDRGTTGYEIELVTNLTRNWTVRGSFAANEVSFTRFYPLLREKLGQAKAAAASRGLNADNATGVTQQFIADAEAADTTANRKNTSLTSRYTFTQGALRGVAIGGSVRSIFGKPWAAIAVGGQTVLPAKDTEDYYVISPFASYRRKFGKTTWTAQINVNNLFDKVTDQGSAYRYTRWSDPRQIITTVTVNY
jgi:outer membrane receptor for ferric coprogen and ferric-rhodotorulic acid